MWHNDISSATSRVKAIDSLSGITEDDRVRGRGPHPAKGLDVGPVTTDALGVSGQVIINAARLWEASALKTAVAANRANLGLIVSDFVYQSAIRHAGSQGDAGAYPDVDVRVKEACIRAWVKFIDPIPPGLPVQQALVWPSRPDQEALRAAGGCLGQAG